MYRKAALASLRSFLKESNNNVMIIPSNDCHFGEYVPDYYKVRGWLSGFDGSAGTLVVTQDRAALWTDSRYFIQAADQLKGCGITLMKIKMEGTPSIPEWINSVAPESRVAIDGNLFSRADFIALSKELTPSLLVPIEDPFVVLWKNRPELSFETIYLIKEEHSGEPVKSKYRRVVDKLGVKGRFAFVISTCDDIMWLCNIRGNDIEYNPVALSYCVVNEKGIVLFCRKEALSKDAGDYLVSQGVEIRNYEEIGQYLSDLDSNIVRIIPSASISVNNFNKACPPGVKCVEDPTVGGTVAMLKCRKNRTEIDGFRKAFLNDGIAWCKFLKYIDDNIDSGTLNEYMLQMKLIEFRSQNADYMAESFEPIIAYNANAACAHYSATNEKDAAKISRKGFLLMDTGAHYPYGTTDTTRTIALSSPTASQKVDYTLVLKGMIDLAEAFFPANTRGSQLDILARGPMYRTGKMYFHGTGHGVGHHLCVHESPQFRLEENPVTLDAGMVMSDEPAIYIEGEYGIRTENVITIVPYMETAFNKFFKFETLTLVPIDTAAVDKSLLTEGEIGWLNKYNSSVYKALAQYLTKEEAKWLKSKTAAI